MQSDSIPGPNPGELLAPVEDNSLRGEMITERLESDLRNQITKGILKRGDPIKPVRDLAKAYAISYNSVRRVLNRLAEDGMLRLEQGRGTFVADIRELSGWTEPVEAKVVAPNDELVSDGPEALLQGQAQAQTQAQVKIEAAVQVQVQDPEPRKAPEVARVRPVESVFLASVSSGLRSWSEWSGRQTFALILPITDPLETFGFGRLLKVVQRRIFENGDCLSMIPPHRSKGWPPPEQMEEAGMRGVLLCGPVSRDVLHAYAASPLPSVLVDHWSERAELNAVTVDNFSGAYMLTKQLIRAGHREVGLLHPKYAGWEGEAHHLDNVNRIERDDACRIALVEDGLRFQKANSINVRADAGPDELARVVLSAENRPTAWLVGNVRMAECLLQGLRASGLSVPGDFSVACFGDSISKNALGLSMARADYGKLGESAVNRLRHLMAGAPAGKLRIHIPADVEVGRTVGPPKRK